MLRALGLGDFLTGIPAYRALRRAYPEHELVLAAPAELRSLAARCGAVDRVLPTRGLDAPLAWRGPAPEVAVNLHGRGPRSHLLLAGVRADRMVAFDHPAASAPGRDSPGPRPPRWLPHEHEVNRWCRLLRESGVPADPADLSLTASRQPRPGGGLAVGGGHVVVHPGAASQSRRWPVDRFAAVAAALRADGHPVVVTGARHEAELAREMAARAGLPPGVVLAGRTDLVELTAWVASAALLVAGDTGVAHLATACRCRSVVLFGPTSPELWGPPLGRSEHVALWHGPRPDGRPGDPHGATPDPLLLRITPSEVLAAARALLAGTAGGAPSGRAPG
jgi:ADP-heptose:LPS heptosyltransferase